MGSIRSFLSLLVCTAFLPSYAQVGEPIHLRNPSFEGIPMEGSLNGPMLSGWYDCGFPSETPPDIHPKERSEFGVDTAPFDGNSYLGMVVRDNDTWERVGQRLSSPLMAGQCYEFSLALARSLLYESSSKTNSQKVNFVTPVKLRIWGGNSICERDELLDESSLVINSRWLTNTFKFKPKRTHQYIVFEAFYKTPSPFPYNGNVLLDNASPIVQVPCDDTLVSLPDDPPPAKPNESGPKAPGPAKPAETPAAPKKILEELDRSKITQGTTIQIDQLFFKSDSFEITPPSFPVLNEIYDFLVSNPDVKVEIGGHTNNIPTHEYCDDLSSKRAKAVADFLTRKGVPQDRIKHQGYGKRKPLVSNTTPTGRKRNQRVEIKILSFDG